MPVVRPRDNIAPTQEILNVRLGGNGREALTLKWGLVPSWSQKTSIAARMINAGSETVDEKPAFREAFKKRRGLIPVDGIYEFM